MFHRIPRRVIGCWFCYDAIVPGYRIETLFQVYQLSPSKPCTQSLYGGQCGAGGRYTTLCSSSIHQVSVVKTDDILWTVHCPQLPDWDPFSSLSAVTQQAVYAIAIRRPPVWSRWSLQLQSCTTRGAQGTKCWTRPPPHIDEVVHKVACAPVQGHTHTQWHTHPVGGQACRLHDHDCVMDINIITTWKLTSKCKLDLC